MYKPNNKKMLTVLISIAMIFSALAILSFAAEPAYATSPTMTSDPVIFAAGAPTVTFITTSGAGFPAGSTVYFYISSTDTASGVIGSYVGSTSLSAGETDVSAAVSITVPSSVAAGSYYLLASNSASPTATGATFNAYVAITVSSITPEIQLSASSQKAGSDIYVSTVTGHPFDAGSTVIFYLNYAGTGNGLLSATPSTVLTVTTGSSGSIPASTYSFIVPTNESQGSYTVVAQETNTLSSTYPNGGPGGITADASFTLNPSITLSVKDISGAVTEPAFTISGYGFTAGATIPASTTTANAVTIGPVNAVQSGISISADGSFSGLSVTLAAAITATGPQTITITTSPSTPSSSFPNAVYVSSPTAVPSITVTDTITGGTSGNVGDTLSIVVLNMLASQSITITMGGSTIKTSTTDVNGFYSTTSATVPAVPGGTYNINAQTSSSSTVTEYVSTQFTVLPSITYGTATLGVTGYYLPVGATITVAGTGLAPNSEYAITDTGFVSAGGTGNVVYDSYAGLVTTTITLGPTTSDAPDEMGILTDGTGSFSLAYTADYYDLSTGANQTITVSGSGLTAQNTYYYAIGSASVTVGAQSYDYASSTQMVSLSVSGLIPYGANIGTLAGAQPVSTYSLVIGTVTSSSSQVGVYVNGGTTSKTVFDSSTGTVSLTFPASDLASAGVKTVNAVYSNFATSTDWTTTSDAVVGSANVVSSEPGTAVGTVSAVTATGSPGQMLYFALYDFPASTSVTYTFYTTSGKQSSTVTTDANGYGNVTFAAPMAPAGTYQITFTVTISGTPSSVTSTFTTTAVLSDVQPTSALYPQTTQTTATSDLYPGQNVTLYAYGLSPDTYYSVYADTSTSPASTDVALATFQTDSSGSYSSGFTVQLPSTLMPGTAYLDVLPTSTMPTGTIAATVYYTFTVGTFTNIFGPTFNYTSNTETAFPGQLVNFAWTPPTSHQPQPVGGSYGPVMVTVYLNGTAYTTSPAAYNPTTHLLSGSFAMPNNDTGAYWTVTLGWTQVDYAAPSVASYAMSLTVTSNPTLKLVSGAGALIVGISTSGLATIVSNAVTSAFKVPLAELNASITSIKGLTANITTAFGKMTTTLSAINATVASIESGQVLVQTDLGSIKTSLASLNASIVAFNGNVATISTTLGNVQSSLSSIGTQVTTNGNGIATITTDLGTLSGTVTSTSGNVASISTSLGTLNATVQKINSNTQGFGTLEVFLIVIVVLVLITLVLSFMAVTAANKASRKVSEEKKQ
jgi:hypothetical protein